jgi:hypothetical protein
MSIKIIGVSCFNYLPLSVPPKGGGQECVSILLLCAKMFQNKLAPFYLTPLNPPLLLERRGGKQDMSKLYEKHLKRGGVR